MDENNQKNIYNRESSNPQIIYSSRQRKSTVIYIIISLISAIIGGLIVAYIALTYFYGETTPAPEIKNPQPITINPNNGITNVTAVYKKSMKSVVGITTVELKSSYFNRLQEVQGLGSGIIIDSKGYILTNSHVIGDGKAKDITVQYENGTKEKASIVWYEQALDLAIIKTKSNNLVPAELGDSDNLEVGELAIAIGNPLGLQFQRTVTLGIISGLKRSIRTQAVLIDDLIQTDASINPGNSGGPLLNAKGQVIGVNTAKITSAEGLGFSVPINTAKPIIEQIIKNGKFDLAYIGIGGYPVDIYERATGERTGADSGVVIVEVAKDSPAFKAGIKASDILTKIDDKQIEDMSTLRRYLYELSPNDSVTIDIIRNRRQRKIQVILGRTPS
ncbi:trypsin-like peptidase domain-containing protein [Clostridiaceae bacterium M8S5]|nr:trypsin-like peptidase domain-containing protein [Clostridiaceae bacterium M8S5]